MIIFYNVAIILADAKSFDTASSRRDNPRCVVSLSKEPHSVGDLMNHRFNARENTGIILAVVAFLCGALEGFAPAQHAAPVYQLQYTISMPQPQTHLLRCVWRLQRST
ncbi:MAG: hypothetical protein WKF84_21255 [Pyrinomonadaceae bacterium]